jgi:hypothetical protein
VPARLPAVLLFSFVKITAMHVGRERRDVYPKPILSTGFIDFRGYSVRPWWISCWYWVQ